MTDFHQSFGLALRTVYSEVASSNLVRLAFGSFPVLGGLSSWGGLGWNQTKAHDLAHGFWGGGVRRSRLSCRGLRMGRDTAPYSWFSSGILGVGVKKALRV